MQYSLNWKTRFETISDPFADTRDGNSVLVESSALRSLLLLIDNASFA